MVVSAAAGSVWDAHRSGRRKHRPRSLCRAPGVVHARRLPFFRKRGDVDRVLLLSSTMMNWARAMTASAAQRL
jgi:hypothetical protein